MDATVPGRVRRAVDLLDPAPDARVLEIGPGPGVSLDLLCRRVPDGHVTGVDRSATAVGRALARNAEHVRDGRLTLHHGSLADVGLDGPFDRVLAVDVNVFWTTPAVAEVRRLRELLAPDGRVVLVFDVPGDAATHPCRTRVPDALAAGGLAASLAPADGLVAVLATHA